jgi:hypothetical protein
MRHSHRGQSGKEAGKKWEIGGKNHPDAIISLINLISSLIILFFSNFPVHQSQVVNEP